MIKHCGLSNLSREDLIRLLELPDHLRRTMTALIELGEASASMVAAETGRARAVESNYLNQLTRLGYLKRTRREKVVIFSRR